MKIKVLRCEFGDTFTRGVMTVDGKFFGYTLEDYVRPGPKVYGETAISAGTYEVVLTMSNRFKRVMPLLLNVKNFEGIRIHGGNSSRDTEGCILVASNSVLKDMIQGSLEKKLTAIMSKLPASESVTIEIINSTDR